MRADQAGAEHVGREGPRVQEQEGQGLRLTWFPAVEEKVSGEVCEGGRRWVSLYAGPRRAGQPCPKALGHFGVSRYCSDWLVIVWGMFSSPELHSVMSCS